MGSIGVPEMLFIFVLALLIFGPKKLPELGRTLGKGLAEFRRASNELKGSLEREMNNIEQETKAAANAASQPATAPAAAPQEPAKTTAENHGYQDGYSYYSEHRD